MRSRGREHAQARVERSRSRVGSGNLCKNGGTGRLATCECVYDSMDEPGCKPVLLERWEDAEGQNLDAMVRVDRR